MCLVAQHHGLVRLVAFIQLFGLSGGGGNAKRRGVQPPRAFAARSGPCAACCAARATRRPAFVMSHMSLDGGGAREGVPAVREASTQHMRLPAVADSLRQAAVWPRRGIVTHINAPRCVCGAELPRRGCLGTPQAVQRRAVWRRCWWFIRPDICTCRAARCQAPWRARSHSHRRGGALRTATPSTKISPGSVSFFFGRSVSVVGLVWGCLLRRGSCLFLRFCFGSPWVGPSRELSRWLFRAWARPAHPSGGRVSPPPRHCCVARSPSSWRRRRCARSLAAPASGRRVPRGAAPRCRGVSPAPSVLCGARWSPHLSKAPPSRHRQAAGVTRFVRSCPRLGLARTRWRAFGALRLAHLRLRSCVRACANPAAAG
jgi:hypothetical protein